MRADPRLSDFKAGSCRNSGFLTSLTLEKSTLRHALLLHVPRSRWASAATALNRASAWSPAPVYSPPGRSGRVRPCLLCSGPPPLGLIPLCSMLGLCCP